MDELEEVPLGDGEEGEVELDPRPPPIIGLLVLFGAASGSGGNLVPPGSCSGGNLPPLLDLSPLDMMVVFVTLLNLL